MTFPPTIANSILLFSSLVLGIVFACPECAHSQNDLKASEVKGGVVGVEKGNNIFDPSPIAKNPTLNTHPSVAPVAPAETQEPAAQEERSESDTEQAEFEENPGPVQGLNRESVVERAGGDSSLMNALEQSRKLRERLGIVGGGKKKGSGAQIDDIKESIEKQKKLKEEQEYQF